MQYRVRIVPITPTVEIWKGPFQSVDEAWKWVEQNNNPLVDYEVVPIESEDTSPKK